MFPWSPPGRDGGLEDDASAPLPALSEALIVALSALKDDVSERIVSC